VIIRFNMGHFLLVVLWNQAFRDINGECDVMIDMSFNDLKTKIKVIHFGTNRFLMYDFL